MCTYCLEKTVNLELEYVVGIEPGKCNHVMLVDEAACEVKVGVYVLMSRDMASWHGDC